MSFSEQIEQTMQDHLHKLTNTTNSIKTLSLWAIHHAKKNADIIVNTWLKEIKASQKSERLITLINLANDIIQNCRKKNPEFMAQFFDVLQPAFVHVAEFGNESCKKSVLRVIRVWRERAIYPKEKLNILDSIFNEGGSTTPSYSPDFGSHDQATPPSSPPTTPESAQKVKQDFKNFTSLSNDLVSILRRLEDPASADGKIRQLIASYPETIANPNLLNKIKTHDESQSLMNKINEASPIVDAYCNRLKEELKDRQNTQYLLVDYLKALSEANERTKALANSVRKRIAHLEAEEKEVAKHIESLPDLNMMFGENPSSSLPTLKDLFKKDLFQ